MRAPLCLIFVLVVVLGCLMENKADALPDKNNHLFRNGMNSPVFGDMFVRKPTGTSEPDYHQIGIKFGVQVLRIEDYASIAFGFGGATGNIGLAPKYYGFLVEAVFFPTFFIHGSLSFMKGRGSVGYYYQATQPDGELGKSLGTVTTASTDITFSLLVRIKRELHGLIGFSTTQAKLTGELTDPTATHHDPKGAAIFLGVRGSAL